jgi:orotidine-5'-phosphate decarboxylase
MIQAARQAADLAGGERPMILAVTVLTSLDQATLNATGVADAPAQQALRLGRLAIDAGADGLICSPHEVAILRQALGPTVRLIVPGIRAADAIADDQARTLTATEAVAAGADWIVVGRPITGADSPELAAAAIAASIQ